MGGGDASTQCVNAMRQRVLWVVNDYSLSNHKRFYLCRMQNAADWLNVNDAAALVGKSLSTVRRLLPGIPPEHIRRVPIAGKGGEQVFVSRGYLLEKFDVRNFPAPIDQTQEPPALVEILERQILAKDRQIEHLQRDGEAKTRQLEEAAQNAARLSDTLQHFATLNAALQSKILLLSEKAGERSERPHTQTQAPWYFVSVAVLLSLITGLLVYLLIQWVGNA